MSAGCSEVDLHRSGGRHAVQIHLHRHLAGTVSDKSASTYIQVVQGDIGRSQLVAHIGGNRLVGGGRRRAIGIRGDTPYLVAERNRQGACPTGIERRPGDLDAGHPSSVGQARSAFGKLYLGLIAADAD